MRHKSNLKVFFCVCKLLIRNINNHVKFFYGYDTFCSIFYYQSLLKRTQKHTYSHTHSTVKKG